MDATGPTPKSEWVMGGLESGPMEGGMTKKEPEWDAVHQGMTSRKMLRRTVTWQGVMMGVDSVGDILGGVRGLKSLDRQRASEGCLTLSY